MRGTEITDVAWGGDGDNVTEMGWEGTRYWERGGDRDKMLSASLATSRTSYVRSSGVPFLADRTNGRAIGTVLRLSVVCL